jgi:hypothetical protein
MAPPQTLLTGLDISSERQTESPMGGGGRGSRSPPRCETRQYFLNRNHLNGIIFNDWGKGREGKCREIGSLENGGDCDDEGTHSSLSLW